MFLPLSSSNDCRTVGPYLLAVHRNEYHGSILGAAKRVAQSMGLSKIGPEPSESESHDGTFVYPWDSRVRREVARRTYLQLVSLSFARTIYPQANPLYIDRT